MSQGPADFAGLYAQIEHRTKWGVAWLFRLVWLTSLAMANRFSDVEGVGRGWLHFQNARRIDFRAGVEHRLGADGTESDRTALLVDHSHLVGGDNDRSEDDQIAGDGVARSHEDDGGAQEGEENRQGVADDDGLLDGEAAGDELVVKMVAVGGEHRPAVHPAPGQGQQRVEDRQSEH